MHILPNNCENYFQLLNDFQETHEDAKRLALLNNRLKSENNKLKEKITVLENGLSNTNADFENLELIYKNSSCNCDSSCCKNCKTLQEKVLYLVKTIDICTDKVIGCDDVDKRKVGGQEGNIVVVYGSGVLRHT